MRRRVGCWGRFSAYNSAVISAWVGIALIKEHGTVVQVGSGRVVVAVVQTSACQTCKAKQGCGQAALSDWGNADHQAAKNHFAIPYEGNLRVGDGVTLGIEEDTLSLAAVWMYIWPLAAAFVGLVIANALTLSEPMQLLCAVVAGGAALFTTRYRFRQAGERWIPRILATHPIEASLIVRSR